MTNFTEKAEKLLSKILERHKNLEEIAEWHRTNSRDFFSYNREDEIRIKQILDNELSFDFLYYGEPSANSKENIGDKNAIDKVQCLADVGIYLATKNNFSSALKLFIIRRTNIIGFLFDRHQYSYYIHQDKIKQFIDAYSVVQQQNIHNFFGNVANLYRILYEVNANIKENIIENIVSEKFEYTFKEEQQKENRLKVTKNDVAEKLYQLDELRNFVKREFASVRFDENLSSNKFTTTDFDMPDFEVIISDYVNMSEKVYHNVICDNDKNIGGRVALIDTNLEYEKLVSINGKYKFNTPSSLHFEEIADTENIFHSAKNEIISIDSITIKK